MKHLIYTNFISLIDGSATDIGWHWRGDASLKTPDNLKNCPVPLKTIFKNLHAQLLQWDSVNIEGSFCLPNISIFDKPLLPVEIVILGKKRKGNLYEWIEKAIFSDKDGWVDTYIFIDNDDKDFCHLIIKNNNTFIPTIFDINDFLLLYGNTRGIEGLYYALANGYDNQFLTKLSYAKTVFPNMDLDFCIELLNKQRDSLEV